MAINAVQMPVQEAPAIANIDVVSLQLSLPQMLDLALGTPEVGVVNFNILHNLLHVLLHQINLRTTKVEYRGEHADRIKTMVTSSKAEPILQLHEYNITDGTGKVSQRMREDDGLEVEVFTEGTPLATVDTVKVTKGVRQQVDPDKEGKAETVIFVEPVINGVLPTAAAFRELEQSMKQLQQQYQALEDLPGTPEIIERLKGRLTDPITDIWQFININKRLDASEQGINKLTTMMQDLMKGDNGVIATMESSLIDARLNELKDKVFKIEQRCTCNLQEITEVLIEDTLPTVGTDVADVISATEAAKAMEAAKATETVKIVDAVEAIDEIEPAVESVATDEEVVREKEETAREIPKAIAEKPNGRPMLAEIGAPVKKPTEKIVETIVDASLVPERPPVAETIADIERIIAVSDVTNFEQCMEVVKNVAMMHNKVLHEITENMIPLENQICQLSEQMDNAQAMNKAHDSDINKLYAMIQEIKMDMEKLEQTTNKLLEDKEKQETHMNELLDQIELLKTVKANKEDLEDALADKADAQAMDRKVSHDRFDAACDDLARGLEDAINKLTKQELVWQQALDEVQNEIAGKADREEMMPLKDFVNSKLKSLQEKLKSMIEAKREIEAAGTKKLLRDVQCISCDKDVVMKREEVSRFRTDPLLCTTSIKPHLTYKLDQIRKQQRRLPHSRNMIQFEAAMQDETRKVKTAREEMLAKTPRDRLSNRYCGGSHTVTTPQQRVPRVSHFLSQWGPEVMQLRDGLIRGKDGQTYCSRLVPDKLDVCGSVCWESQSGEETPRSTERAPSVSTPCRKAPPQSRRNVGSQKPTTRRVADNSREPRTSELAEKPIAEMHPKPSTQQGDYSLITPLVPVQDEIMPLEMNKATEK